MTAARMGSSLRSRPPGPLSSASRLTIQALAAGLRSKVSASRWTMTPSFLMTIWAVNAFEPSFRERPIIVPILPPRQSVVSVGSIKNSVRHDPQKYDFVVPQTGEWLKMSRKWYDISPNEINQMTDKLEKL